MPKIILHPAQALIAEDVAIRVDAHELGRIFDHARAMGLACRIEAVKKDGTPRVFVACNATKAARAAITGTGNAILKPTQRRIWDATANGWRIVDLAAAYRVKCGSVFYRAS